MKYVKCSLIVLDKKNAPELYDFWKLIVICVSFGFSLLMMDKKRNIIR